MATEEKIPPAGESVTEVTFIKWARQDGEFVKEGDPIAEVETDKANADLYADASGVLKYKPGVTQGKVLKIGEVFATIDASAKPTATATAPSAPAAAPKPAGATPVNDSKPIAAPVNSPVNASKIEDLSPAARRAAAEGNVDVSKLVGTGPGGRVTKEDIEKTGNGVPAAAASSSSTSTAAPATAAAALSKPSVPNTQSTAPVLSAGGMRRTPMSKIRKKIAENLVRAKNTTAMLTTFNEVDMSAIMKLRTQYKEPFEKKHGIGLGFMGFFVKAVAIGLKEFERVNGQIDGDDVVLFDNVHMGVAVSTERGLTVPVLKYAEQMSFARIENEIKRVATAAREGKLGIDEMSGGTFTITNGGIFGSLNSTPIINPPQSAILGMHAIVQRPVAIDGKVEIRPMMNLALSYDHRIVDGKESVSFLVRVKQLLEDPTRLLLDV
jgi:2-oxoglutarate dehydrogenase E2 component (dihydrolipoamide succinyltransferase)